MAQENAARKERSTKAEVNPAQVAAATCDVQNEAPSLYKLVWLFAIGCVLGFVLESGYCLVTKGYIESRRGMVWGPFNQVYGFGLVVMVMMLTPLAKSKRGHLFIGAAILGGVVEFVLSWVQEKVLGTVSWDYRGQPFSIGGRTSLGFMLYWGILGVLLMKHIYPVLSRWIDRIPRQPGVAVSRLLAGFLVVNMLVSLFAVGRWQERGRGVPPESAVESYLDERFTDERMERIYPNMRITQ